MPTLDELADDYANKIRAALTEDIRTKTASAILEHRTPVKKARVAAALMEVGQSLDRLVSSRTKLPLSEEDKQEISDSIAEKLNLPQRGRLRGVLKEASVQNFLVILADIEAMLRREK